MGKECQYVREQTSSMIRLDDSKKHATGPEGNWVLVESTLESASGWAIMLPW